MVKSSEKHADLEVEVQNGKERALSWAPLARHKVSGEQNS